MKPWRERLALPVDPRRVRAVERGVGPPVPAGGADHYHSPVVTRHALSASGCLPTSRAERKRPTKSSLN